jgi:hypothetical protein
MDTAPLKCIASALSQLGSKNPLFKKPMSLHKDMGFLKHIGVDLGHSQYVSEEQRHSGTFHRPYDQGPPVSPLEERPVWMSGFPTWEFVPKSYKPLQIVSCLKNKNRTGLSSREISAPVCLSDILIPVSPSGCVKRPRIQSNKVTIK